LKSDIVTSFELRNCYGVGISSLSDHIPGAAAELQQA